jgi:2-polyprenyl-3-methyl-5-hydroxy-6-metoxy-1,4-benzoquinol methylase
MDAQYTAEYEHFEMNHWWHVVRQEIIQHALLKHVPNPELARWLDVGCGTGVLLAATPEFPDRMGLEMDEGSVKRAQEKGLDVRQVQPKWDFTDYGRFDVVTLCDVIEHVEHEEDAINAVRQVLNPGGTVLVTVPALKSLWSAHDVRNHHFRRYDRRMLLAAFSEGDWHIERVTYFSSFLLPMVWTFRQLKNLRYGTDPAKTPDDKQFGKLDPLFLRIFRAESQLLKVADMPLGSSLILVAKKK